ncbi:MAG: translation initiation factor IF-2 [Candidatus Brocadiales bacterium]
MAKKIRISTLAKEMGVKSGLILEKCKKHGLTHITHHANTVEDKEATLIRSFFEPSVSPAGAREVSKAAPKVVTPKEVSKPVKHKVLPKRAEATEAKLVTLPAKGKAGTEAKPLPKLIRPPKYIAVPRRPPFRKHIRAGFRRRRRGRPGEADRPYREAVVAPRVTTEGLKLTLEAPVTVKELSSKLGIKASSIIMKLLMEHNVRATMNQTLDEDVVVLLGMEYGAEIELKKPQEVGKAIEKEFEELVSKPEDLVPRPPIVTFLGHVDHGKTSLLDAIRKANVVAGEAGGITQHIGAYRVETNARSVTFLDTPGHEAFTSMRARGSQVTDVAVLVVAADDGVMPQTEEAINHARAAGVPIVVAINKIDKPDANPLRVKQQLAKLELVPEEWGGKTQFVETSAVTKQGLDELLEKLLLEAELLELKANPKKPAKGVVLEARLHEGRGVVATVIVQDGTLHLGDVLICGNAYGRARAIYNDKGKATEHAEPSQPASISDLSVVPNAGEKFYVIKDIQRAKQIAEKRRENLREAGLQAREHVTLENLYTNIERGKIKELRIILKADVKGSVEVMENMLTELSTEEIKIRILHRGVGNITESDVILADASDAIIIGFYSTPEDGVANLAEKSGVEIRLYQVIYDVTNDIKSAMEGMLEPEQREVILGNAEIQQVFKVSKLGNIAGCIVRGGKITRNAQVRIRRDGNVIHEGKLASLRIVREDVKEVRQGLECGMRVAGFDDIRVGDTIEAYEIQQIARTLS